MYKIIETTKYYGLHKIEAIDTLTFGDIVVAPGTRGGWIENLQENAWADGEAIICGDAVVSGNARLFDNATICGNAKVYGNAVVRSYAKVMDNACVCRRLWCRYGIG